jgi:hypothetical protein
MGFFMGVAEDRILDMAKLHASDVLKRRWPNRYIGKPVLNLDTCIDGLVEMGALDGEIVKLTSKKVSLVHWLLSHIEAKKASPAYNDTSFYKSAAWRKLRFSVLKSNGAVCAACGASAKNGAVLHVDHIKPRSQYPELALDPANLQVLCEDCNLGKMDGQAVSFK